MRPSGSEAQCPICDRIFGSDSTCEKHKPYAKPKTETCKDPADLGMEIRWRRNGVAVWVRPMPSDAANLRRAGNGEAPVRGGLGPGRVPTPHGFDGSSDE